MKNNCIKYIFTLVAGFSVLSSFAQIPDPVKIEAEDYDNGSSGQTFFDTDVGNNGSVYRNDDVDIQECEDVGGGYNLGWTADGEWLIYTINVIQTANYYLEMRYAGEVSSVISLESDGESKVKNLSLNTTGGWQDWSTVKSNKFVLQKGEHKIRLYFNQGGINLNHFTLTTEKQLPDPGFLGKSGKVFTNNNGVLQLRTINLGGWMLQEGYMMKTSAFANPQYEIRNKIAEVIGDDGADNFYEAWLANHCRKIDVDSIAAWGFNSIRLPMHYNLFTLPIEDEPFANQQTWLNKGFEMVDSLLAWCADNQIYLILDMHACPGGQGVDEAISDYDPSKPSLWESEANKTKLIALWRRLAERYADNPWMGGYDLINETNWAFEGSNENGCTEDNNGPLKDLLVDITTAIREVDNQHLIYIEGNCWANNHNGIWPPWDDNLIISFHKYWTVNDQNSIQEYLNLRDQYNLPLWVGESGENSNKWFTDAIKLLEDNNIGWAWWPMKKIDALNNLCNIPSSEGYSQLLNYWENGGNKPSRNFAYTTLMQLAENTKFENCKIQRDVIDAMFRQVYQNDETLPFSNNRLPAELKVVNFDLGDHYKAYRDVGDSGFYHVSLGGTFGVFNQGWSYRNDLADIQYSDQENDFTMGWISDKEWYKYTVYPSTNGTYELKVRYAGFGGKLNVYVDGDFANTISFLSTGDWSIWNTATIGNIELNEKQHTIRIEAETAGFNLSKLQFDLLENDCNGDFGGSAYQDNCGRCVGGNTGKTSCAIRYPYHGNPIPIPGIVETEDFDFSSNGITYQDSDNGNNGNTYRISDVDIEEIMEDEYVVAWTADNEWLEYTVNISNTGDYNLTVTSSSESAGGTLQLFVDGVSIKDHISLPVTNDWTNYQSTDFGPVNLSTGEHILRILIKGGGVNLDHIQFEESIINGIDDATGSDLFLYPNPVAVNEQLHFKNAGERVEVSVLNSQGIAVMNQLTDQSSVTIQNLSSGYYILKVKGSTQSYTTRFVIK